jgi:putative N6-adenine-specific DNA methylase
MSSYEEFHAKTLKGLEPLLAEELLALGAVRTETGNRGVTFFGGMALMYRVNLASRLALRVLLPIFRFEASDPDTLYRKVKRFDWSRYLDNRMTFAIDPVIHSPHFKHSQYVAQKVKDAIADRFREQTSLRPSVNREQPDLLINVHISGKLVTISLDSSGGSLHRRGYRTGSAGGRNGYDDRVGWRDSVSGSHVRFRNPCYRSRADRRKHSSGYFQESVRFRELEGF